MAVTISTSDIFGSGSDAKPLSTGLDQMGQSRLLAVAKALVEDYAEGAPDDVQNEAVVRLCGWLLQAPTDGRTTDRDDTYMVRWSAHGQRGFLLSGAQDLLRPWHVQNERAGVI